MNPRITAYLAAFALCASPLAAADDSSELAEIRREMESLRQQYESRLRELENRLEQAQALAERNRSELASTAKDGSTGEVGEDTPAGTVTPSNAFNPALSVIMQGSLNSYSEDPTGYRLPGFQLGGEAGLAAEGFTLDETEITASASVDHLFYAETTVGLHEDEDGTEVEIEEAFVQPLQLPAGFGGRFGRFYSGVGYLNRFHSHAWDFHDQPLAYRAFLGNQYRDDGMRLSWTAPSDLYVMLGGETLAGNRFPAGQSQSVTGDVQTLLAKIGGDVGVSHAWQAGISGLFADAHEREGGGHQHGDAEDASSVFSGDSDLLIAEVLWKWAPNGNPRQRNLILQGEYFYREESGDVMFTEAGNEALLDYDGEQQGWYAQFVYQFIPHWRAGVRYDWLESDNRLRISDLGGFTDPDEVLDESGFSDADGNPERWSLMLDWTPSEFSRVRAQYNRDESLPGVKDNQWSLQYIMSLGSHGAHEF